MEEVVEFKGGRKQIVQRKVFPGYLLVRCRMDDESWYCIHNTPGVPVGSVVPSRQGPEPLALSPREVRRVPRPPRQRGRRPERKSQPPPRTCKR